MNDKILIELLRNNKTDKAFGKLYKGYPKIERLITSKGGTKSDAQDVFQEALIILYRKVTTSDFTLTSQLSTYLYSVSRFLWKDELIKSKRIQQQDFKLDLIPDEITELELLMEKENKLKQVEEILQSITEKCREILQLFYFKELKMREISVKLGYSSEKVAKTQKYKCMEEAKRKIIL